MTEIFKAVLPDGTYQPDRHITQQVVDQSKLFSGRYQKFTGDDLIRGRARDVEFEASEILDQPAARTFEGAEMTPGGLDVSSR